MNPTKRSNDLEKRNETLLHPAVLGADLEKRNETLLHPAVLGANHRLPLSRNLANVEPVASLPRRHVLALPSHENVEPAVHLPPRRLPVLNNNLPQQQTIRNKQIL
jgi:hypothetical protein